MWISLSTFCAIVAVIILRVRDMLSGVAQRCQHVKFVSSFRFRQSVVTRPPWNTYRRKQRGVIKDQV